MPVFPHSFSRVLFAGQWPQVGRAVVLAGLLAVFPEAAAAASGEGVVRYGDFGAKGDGKTDDLPAIVAAHAYANEHGLPVRAEDGARYYIGGRDLTAIIQTDTHFGSAEFLIDDRVLEDHLANVFEIRSTMEPFELAGVERLKKNQERIDVSLPSACLVMVENSSVRHFIRFGLNRNEGKPQTDLFVVDENGRVDPETPIIWDFEQITRITAQPVDREKLTIEGGRFTTIAHGEESTEYHARGILVRRSNVEIRGLEHTVTGEGEHGPPYRGFLHIVESAHVTVRDSVFTGRKHYKKIGNAGKPVSMGTYGIRVDRSSHVSFLNCRQSNDIMDPSRWGIMATNHCKNLLLEECTFSRFDAHMGVTNATLRDSTFGYAGIAVIGHGTLLVEGCTVRGGGGAFITLRPDYGSTWTGDFVIRDSVFVPRNFNRVVALIAGKNSGQHDFGYPCSLPEEIRIENFTFEDANAPADYEGPVVFRDFNPSFRRGETVEKFPYGRPREVILENVTSASGKPVRLSDNAALFEGVDVHERKRTGEGRVVK